MKLVESITKRRQRRAFERTFTSEDGRMVLAELMRQTRFHRSTGASSVEVANYAAGQRDLVAAIVQLAGLVSTDLYAIESEEAIRRDEEKRRSA